MSKLLLLASVEAMLTAVMVTVGSITSGLISA